MSKGYFYIEKDYSNAPKIHISANGKQVTVVSSKGLDSFENPFATK
jgi:hypothetical protein